MVSFYPPAAPHRPNLQELICGLPVRGVYGSLEAPVGSVVEDSRKVVAESAFFVCPGERTHGLHYVHEAVQAGASVIFTETPVTLPAPVTQVRLSNLDSMRHIIPARFYNEPNRAMSLIGVIGSRIRTQVSSLAHYLLDRLNDPTGLINAHCYDFGNTIELAHLATPEPCDLYRILHKMDLCQRDNVVMEISTQGLLRRRVQSLGMHVLAFTDHAYDPTVKDECGDVLPLKLDAFLRGWDRGVPDVAVINRDSSQAAQLIARMPMGVATVTFGIGGHADVRAENLRRSPLGWHFTLAWEGGRLDTLYAVRGGKERLYEALGALAITYGLGRDLYDMAWHLSDWRGDCELRHWLV